MRLVGWGVGTLQKTNCSGSFQQRPESIKAGCIPKGFPGQTSHGIGPPAAREDNRTKIHMEQAKVNKPFGLG